MAKAKKVARKEGQALMSMTPALQAAIASLQKENGIESIVVLGDVDGHTWHGKTISTRCITLDKALGIIKKDGDEFTYGLPGGRVVEVQGGEGSGKTTLCNGIVACAQEQGGTCAIIDMEHSWDGDYASKLGVDLDKLIFAQPANAELALNMIEALARTGDVDVIVLDSVAALVPKAEIEGEVGASHMGLQARLMSQFLRKMVGILSKSNTCLIMTNQYREKIGIVFGDPRTTPGGNALKYYASIRMEIKVTAKLKDEAGEVIGNRCQVKIIKNKIAPPFKCAEFDMIHGTGIDRHGAVLDAGVDVGVIAKKGAWYAYCGENLACGRAASVALLKSNDIMFKAITKEVINKIYEEKNGISEKVIEVVTNPEEQLIGTTPDGV